MHCVGLSDIKKAIDADAAAAAQKNIDGAKRQEAEIIGQARLRAEEIRKNASERAKALRETLLKEAEAELSVEVGNMLASAREEVVSKQLPAIKKAVAKELEKSYTGEISEKALRFFSTVTQKDDIIVEGSGKVLEKLKKGYGKKVVNNSISGVIIYTSDKKARLDADVNDITEDAANQIKGAISECLFGE